ncbi:MAG TPA: cupin [Solibacterales bacterium]|nr:cupin [Bryobacterales bacterium]
MSEIIVRNLLEHGQVPESSILSSTLQNDEFSKFILFRFAAGQELSAHTAPFPATLYFVSGDADLRLGDEQHQAAPGTWAYMPANLVHGIKARTEVVMLLTMLKGAKSGA